MDDVAQDIQQSNQEVVEHLESMNDSIRKSYASQNSQNMRPSQTQSQSQGQSRSQSQGGSRPQQSQSMGRSGDNSGEGLSSGQDDRMKRLKEKFGKMKDE
jgi:hypothetical protein